MLLPTSETGNQNEAQMTTRLHDTLEVLGLKRAFFDDGLRPYIGRLHSKWGELRETCKPSWRIDEPLPPMP